MVSFENGRFVLRRRDERVHSKNKRRSLIRKRVVLIVISFSFIYAMHRRLQQQQYGPQSTYSKSLRKGNATLHADNNEDDDEELKSRPNNNEPSQKHDVPPTQHNRRSSDQKQYEVENSDDSNSECNVSLNQTFIHYLQTLPPIPKKVHIFVSIY